MTRVIPSGLFGKGRAPGYRCMSTARPLCMNLDSGLRPVRICDLPTRVFHWVLAAAVIGAVVTAKIGGNAMDWHMRLGLLVLALLVFRLLWGFVGGYWSRFAAFLVSPRSMVSFLRGDRGPGGRWSIGHSPLGGLSVIALLTLLIVQALTGLVADDEIATTGPLNRFVEPSWALKASAWHETGGQYLIYLLVALHIGAVLYYVRVKKVDLIGPMWHGDKRLAPGTPDSADGVRERAIASVLIAACLGAAWWMARLGGG
jgi:cytochrome b